MGEHLFGLLPDEYASLLRLIYWLRQPQVGEEIDPKKLAAQLVNALPFLDQDTLEAAGSTFDELQAHGEELDRLDQAAVALAAFVDTYAGYARSVVASRGQAAQNASAAVKRARRNVRGAETELATARDNLAQADAERGAAADRGRQADARIAALEASPEAKSRAGLAELGKLVGQLESAAAAAQLDLQGANRRARGSADAAATAEERLGGVLRDLREATAQAHTTLTEAGAVPEPAPAALALLVIAAWGTAVDLEQHVAEIAAVGEAHNTWASSSRSRIGQRRAAVTVVSDALAAAAAAQAAAVDAQSRADEQEGRSEQARRDAEAAEADTRSVAATFATDFGEWRADPVAAGLELPRLADLTEQIVDGLPARIEQVVAPERQARASAVAAEDLRVRQAVEAISELRARRSQIEAEVDPTPAPPTWARDSRDGLEGAPFWRVVDFKTELDAAARAGLEAALEGAGLLDAWVTPDGAMVDAQRRDVRMIAPGAPDVADVTGSDATSNGQPDHRTLGDWLVADPPEAGQFSVAAIEAILGAIGVLGDDAAGEQGEPRAGDDPVADPGAGADVAVGTDGRWVVGPAHGRTTKHMAQYIGASAREQERRRRLEQIDSEIAGQQAARASAAADHEKAEAAAKHLQKWASSRPSHTALLGAWAKQTALAEAMRREDAAFASMLAAVRAAREKAAARQIELHRLGELHTLPVTADGLNARREALGVAEDLLARGERAARDLGHAAGEWLGHASRAREDGDDATDKQARLDDAESLARGERARYEELAETAGAGIAELEKRLAQQRSLLAAAKADEERHDGEHDTLLGLVGRLEGEVENRRAELAAAEPLLEQAYDAFTALHGVAGLIHAAGVTPDPTVPPSDPAEVRRMTAAAQAGSHAAPNDLLQAATVLQNSPASKYEPRLVEHEGVMAGIGRGDSGDEALPDLAARLTVKVEADRALLTDRERELFETHILGQLGDELRGVRRQADELVKAMNGQLHSVSTSQGIRVRLRWRQRDDLPADARRALTLLAQPSGALLAEERADLRDALHRLIDVSRAESPEDSYTEHLARALDYRAWSAFTVQYHRPETGEWRDLQARSALSQGEQKVLCYLPLFAAAAAHFTSLAGAAPYAPRFVLLDDAFPKIDARTHPLLFGLLVDLDLDFVVTSERLWGTHATVPSLAIYEALRNPSQRGIAQFEHRWDGRELTAVGAHG